MILRFYFLLKCSCVFLKAAFFTLVLFFCDLSLSQNSSSPKPLVLLIGIDGFKPSYLNLGVTPNLNSMAERGILSKGLISAFPSLTFPNFVSLVTGLTPDHHGIVNNTMTDVRTDQMFTLGSREAVENPFWWSQVTPIWSNLRSHGGIASAMFWPGSEVEINGQRPNDWLRYEHGMSHEKRLDHLLSWLSRPEPLRSDFATLYLSDVDSAGHEFGPESQELKRAVAKVDQTLGNLISRLENLGLVEKTTFVIVSDHGMASTPVEKSIDVSQLLKDFPKARWEWQGATSGVRLNAEEESKVLAILATQAHLSCYSKSNLPKRFKFGTHPRIPDLICLSDIGYAVSANPARKGPLGQHGFDPQLPDMHGLFLASGYKLKHSELGLVENLEVYPFLCELLGIKEESNDAKHILRNLIQK
jgi:predicted AlkP superfamily pyrophosphatase or phosphodiesterase